MKVAGTSYTGVPAIILPLATGSGTAKFTDTSASTVTAERIVSGYGAYDSTGTWVNGTSPGENIVIDEVWSISGDTLFIDDGEGGGGITPAGTINISQNGTVDVTNYASANVAVPASAVDAGTKSITSNGNNQDVIGYAAVNVNVPNTYSASDEGKVVSNGALVAQGSDTVTQNGTVDTTLISSLTVNVSSGTGKRVVTGTFTPSKKYNTSTNVLVTTTSNIGFTPTVFCLYITNFSNVSETQYAMVQSYYQTGGDPAYYLRYFMRTSNTSSSTNVGHNRTSWTTRNDGYLYYSSNNIYLRCASNCILLPSEYTWYAIE